MNVIEGGLDHVVVSAPARKVQVVVVLQAIMDSTVTTQCAPITVNRVNASWMMEIHSASVLLASVVTDANTMIVTIFAIVVRVVLLLMELSATVKKVILVSSVWSLSQVLTLVFPMIVKMVEHAI